MKSTDADSREHGPIVNAQKAGGAPRLIALDWGTSSLRAFLLADDAVVLEQRAMDRGILRLPSPGGRKGFEAAFAEAVGRWLGQWPTLPVVASGMVGSAQGWQEVPYVPCPADVRALADHALRLPTPLGQDLWLVPGLRYDPVAGAPDVMRGEEMQIAGALELQPAWAARARVVLPGTHSKWVQVDGGRVTVFATHMTGELYAVLRQHSILGRLMPISAATALPDAGGSAAQAAAFTSGVDAARGSAAGELGHQLFAVRTLGLTGRLATDVLGDYLSGLLIGHELVAGLAASATARSAGAPLLLIGDAALCRRYVDALARFDVRADAVLDNTAPRGLWALARAAGLLPRDSIAPTT